MTLCRVIERVTFVHSFFSVNVVNVTMHSAIIKCQLDASSVRCRGAPAFSCRQLMDIKLCADDLLHRECEIENERQLHGRSQYSEIGQTLSSTMYTPQPEEMAKTHNGNVTASCSSSCETPPATHAGIIVS
jgi:hypothetical protein